MRPASRTSCEEPADARRGRRAEGATSSRREAPSLDKYEKITWGKLEAKGPKFIIESDATIVAPLIFSYVLAS